LKGFLNLPPAEREEYESNPNLWAEHHLGAFKPSLQTTIRKWMGDFFNQYKFVSQTGMEKNV
jgi:hypothetical protein